eukprot:359300-Chlamydomonas_euryale.AAC.4
MRPLLTGTRHTIDFAWTGARHTSDPPWTGTRHSGMHIARSVPKRASCARPIDQSRLGWIRD